jgi:hypothetical protein
MGRNSSVNRMTGHGLEDRTSIPDRGVGNVLVATTSTTTPPPHLLFLSVVGVGDQKWPDYEADYSPSSRSGVGNAWIFTSTPLTFFRGMMLMHSFCIPKFERRQDSYSKSTYY